VGLRGLAVEEAAEGALVRLKRRLKFKGAAAVRGRRNKAGSENLKGIERGAGDSRCWSWQDGDWID